MIPVRVIASPSAQARWALSASAELVLDDSSGVAAIPRAHAPLWVARCLLHGVEGAGDSVQEAEVLAAWIRLRTDGPLGPGSVIWVGRPGDSSPEVPPRFAALAWHAGSTWRGPRAVILSGPRTGAVEPLPRGETMLGRAGGLVLPDPLVSRQEAVITTGPTTTALKRLPGAAPLALVREGAVTWLAEGRSVLLRGGEEIICGSSRVRFLPGGGSTAAATPLERGPLPSTESLRDPELREPPPRSRVRAALSALPLLLALIAALALRQPMYLLFGLLSISGVLLPLMERRRLAAAMEASVAEVLTARRIALSIALPPLPVLVAERQTGRAREPLGPDSLAVLALGGPCALEVVHGARTAGALTSGSAASAVVIRLGTWLGSAGSSAPPAEAGVIIPHGDGRLPDGAMAAGPLLGRPVRGEGTTETLPVFSLETGDPRGTLRALLMSCALAESPVPVWVHPGEAEVELMALPGVSWLARHDALHICARAHCDKAAMAVIRLCEPSAGLTRLSEAGDRLVPDTLSRHAALGAIDALRSCGVVVMAEEAPQLLTASVSVRLGRGTSEAEALDVGKDGPHVLVVGTTGCGKTELLKTLVGSLARQNSPRGLRFVLVDFKGGSGFSVFESLPHTDALVSNLTVEDVDRVLRSLLAEITRREQWLIDHGYPDLRTARAAKTPDAPPLCVIVVDELKAFVDSSPNAPTALARIAALGRSLGMHLVLASQRASGAVSPDLRANLGSIIAMRVATAADSLDVLGTADAARLAHDRPGLFYRWTAGSVAGPFAARTLADCPAAPNPTVHSWSSLDTVGPSRQAQGCDTDDSASVAALGRLWANQASLPQWASPIAPPLPHPDDMDADDGSAGGQPGIGVVDIPDRQRTETLAAAPHGALLFGHPAHGVRESALTMALASLAPAPLDPEAPSEALVLVASAAGPLRALEPHATHVAFLGSPLDLRDLVEVLPAPHQLSTVVLESLDEILDSLRTLGPRSGEEELSRWLNSAVRAGARVIATTLRDPGRLSAAFSAWACFPMGVTAQTRVAWPLCRSASAVPGRAWISGRWRVAHQPALDQDPAHNQNAALDRAGLEGWEDIGSDTADLDADHACQFRLTTAGTATPAAPARRVFGPLPVRCRWEENTPISRDAVPLGVGTSGESFTVDLSRPGLFWVIGPPQSGRSTALAWLQSAAPHAVFHDDADTLPSARSTALIEQARERTVVIGVSPPVGISLQAAARSAGQPLGGLVLSPSSASDGDVLGQRILAFPTPDPGAGWLVTGGRPKRIRVFEAGLPQTTDESPARTPQRASPRRGR